MKLCKLSRQCSAFNASMRKGKSIAKGLTHEKSLSNSPPPVDNNKTRPISFGLLLQKCNFFNSPNHSNVFPIRLSCIIPYWYVIGKRQYILVLYVEIQRRFSPDIKFQGTKPGYKMHLCLFTGRYYPNQMVKCVYTLTFNAISPIIRLYISTRPTFGCQPSARSEELSSFI